VVTDDGSPAGSSVSSNWTKVSGPGAVSFDDATQPITHATFSTAGTYVLRLTATDTELSSTGDVTINVQPQPINQAPTVNAGADQSITLPTDTVSLSGTGTDDGLPTGSTLTFTWTKVTGPGTVTFSTPNQQSTTAQFSAAGSYQLRLTVSDSLLTASDDVIVTVSAANQAPTVSAGADQNILVTDNANLNGTVSDDGLPAGSSVSSTWTKVSGPGTVTFANPNVTVTSASFSEAGTYVLRLTATDSELSTSDELTVTVNPAQPRPTVEILAPTDGTEITSPTDVIGSVSNGAWKLEYSLNTDDGASNQAWTTFATGNGQVTNARLGTLDSTLMLNGIYNVRLSATDEYGQISLTSISVMVSRQLKIGNFTVSLTDLSVPVAGLPIEVTRTYDSRDKRKGDFGVGWTLGISNVRLEKSNVLGRHWYQTASNTFPPNYCFVETKPHVVTITFPDGNFYKFQAAPERQCQRFAPITGTHIVFSPMPGTRGKLTVEGSNEVLVAGSIPGPVDLLTFSDPDIFNSTLFHLTTEDGRDYLIDQKGGVRKVTDPNGNYLTVDANGVTHSSGKSITFTRDSEGRITQITDPAGNTQTYTYDSNGDLVSYKDRENNVSTYTYNSTHGLLKLTDPRGLQPIRNEYDDSGRLLSHTDAFGKKIQYEHDLAARSDVITDRLGNQTRYEYDAHGNILRSVDAKGGVKLFTYDADDNVLTETNALGKTTIYTYDSEGHRTSITDPLGNVTRYTYNGQGKVLTTTDPLNHVTSNTYDGAGNLLKTKDALGNETTNGYGAFDGLLLNSTDALGGVTTYTYTNGTLTKVTDALGSATTYTYDANGNRASQSVTRTTAAGATETLTTQFQYDRLNRLTKTTYPDGSTIQTEYNSMGQESAIIDQLGHRTTYDYDDMGRLLKVTFADGTKEESTYNAEGRKLTSKDRAGRTTSYEYDELGRMVKTTYPDGTFTTTAYDAIGRVTSSTDARGQTTVFEYDPNCGCSGRRSKVTNALNQVMTFTYDGNGNELSKTDANNHTTTYEYDALNRRTKVKYEDGTSLTTAYDAIGRIKSKTDQAGKTTQFEYDKLGRLIKVTDALNQVTAYTYNEVGQQTAETDAANHTTRYEYDKMGRRLKRVLPLGMSETYTYDAAGKMLSRTDFNGKVTTYSYDLMSRLLQKTPDASFNQPAVTFTYTTAGLRQTMTDASGVTTYTYDGRDRLKSKQTTSGTLNYTYDEVGNLKTLRSSNPHGVSVDYTYNQLNMLSTVSDGNLPVGANATTYSYDSAGNLQGYVYPNGVQTTHSYNSLNRLTSMTAGSSSAATLASYTYTLGAAGNRLSVTELDGRTAEYTYDDLYRLTKETISNDPQATGNGAVDYTYDAVGNRLTRSASLTGLPNQTLAYDANNRLTSDTFDNNGSTINSNGTAYSFDWENRLSSVNNGSVSYLYDGDGNRVAKSVGGVTTRYLVDTNNLTGYAQVVDEIVGTSVQRTYTYGHDLISENQLVGGNWNVSYYGYDGHGSVRYLTDSAGTITDTYTYDAFGSLLAATGTTPNEYLYAGERFDAETGLYNLRARQMNPSTGRFWEMDDYEGYKNEPRSLHKYLYTSDDPVNSIDPSGKDGIGISGQMITIGMLVQLAVLSVATVCAYQWAVSNTLDAVDIDYSSAPPSPCIKRPDPRLTFYRGTTAYEAEEAVLTGHIDTSRIAAHQTSYTSYANDPDRGGVVYFTRQLTTAMYYASQFGHGIGGGPGLIIATTRANRFYSFAAKWQIAIEAPVPDPPTPGQTETLIPFVAMPEFETFTRYTR
jgi:RHS repeat-associated protein